MAEFKFLGLDGNITEGQITQIYVNVGDEVKVGQNLFELEAEKLSQAVQAQVDGKIGQINFNVGDIIKKDDIFATSESSSNIKNNDEVKEQPLTSPVEANSQLTNNLNNKTDKVLATPLARAMARDLGININTIKGTGPNSRVLKADILNHNVRGVVNEEETIVKPKVAQQRVKMTPTRVAIAKAMVKSVFTIPHTTLMIDVNVTSLSTIRDQLKVYAAEKNINLTYTAFFVKAAVMALKKFPILNAQLDIEKEEIIYNNNFNIGMATDTEKGLMVPVIHEADQLSLFKVAEKISELSTKTREGKISAMEMKGGTFTITNYGSVGLKYGAPVINYPESAILGIGAIVKTPVVDKNNTISIGQILPLSISIDHRIIDGADAGRFLQEVKKILENPTSIFVEGVK